MKTKEAKRQQEKDRRQRLLLAGMCVRCMGNRTSVLGYTSDRCAECAEKFRVKSRNRMREKRGTPMDRPTAPSKCLGPRQNLMTLIHRSDVYAPETYKLLRSGRRKAEQTETHVEAKAAPTRAKKPPKLYGSLSREDIRAATATLPAKPPGK
jgi:hypothetical protein